METDFTQLHQGFDMQFISKIDSLQGDQSSMLVVLHIIPYANGTTQAHQFLERPKVAFFMVSPTRGMEPQPPSH